VITGGARGIGRATALGLARAGAAVVVNDLGVSLAGEGEDYSPTQQVVGEIVAVGGHAVANGDSLRAGMAGKRWCRQRLTI
jgi:NAD(P)-dependent dehydrogenase (short-subunit alcohol dehydrogenase family)